jgi:hypothetical protein
MAGVVSRTSLLVVMAPLRYVLPLPVEAGRSPTSIVRGRIIKWLVGFIHEAMEAFKLTFQPFVLGEKNFLSLLVLGTFLLQGEG